MKDRIGNTLNVGDKALAIHPETYKNFIVTIEVIKKNDVIGIECEAEVTDSDYEVFTFIGDDLELLNK